MDMLEHSATTEIQGPSAFYYREEEPWEDLVDRVVGTISICVPYTANGRLLRPLYGRLRSGGIRRTQGSEDDSMDEPVSTGISHEYQEEGESVHEDEEPPCDYLEQLYLGRLLSESKRRRKVGDPPR